MNELIAWHERAQRAYEDAGLWRHAARHAYFLRALEALRG